MVNLIGNEIKKIFSKMAIKVIIIIAVLLMILQVVMVKYYNEIINYTYSYIDQDIEFYENELKNINLVQNREYYIDTKSQLDLLKLQKEYQNQDKWKLICIQSNAYEYVYNINRVEYGIEVNKQELETAKKEYDEYIKILENNDWRVYVKGLLDKANGELEISKQELESAPKLQKKQIEISVALKELEVEVLNLRLNKNIPYDNSYMDKALEEYFNGMSYVIQNEGSKENPELMNELKSRATIAKYSIDTEQDLYNTKNASALYENYITSIGILILTLTVIVVSASIVSEEFNKGTIKQLLIRPYRRTKIWLAKYLTTIIVTIIVMLIISFLAALIFGIFMGFGDYGVYNIGVYDYNTASAYSMNVFAYVGIIFISKLPYLIMMGTIAIFISTILNNTAMAVAIPLLGTITVDIINFLLSNYEKFRFLKYFITPNWDWSIYNFGKPSTLEFLNFRFSVLVYGIWLIGLIGLAIYRFKKEDIKNI